MVVKQIIVENFGYRLGVYHPTATIQVGRGNADGDIMVVQPHTKMPDRDAVTGALRKFNMLSDAYRATSVMVEYGHPPNIEYPDLARQNMRGEGPRTQPQINRAYLKELIEIVRPLMIVACGMEVMSLLADRKIRSFKGHTGKKFQVKDLPSCVFYAILNPTEYGFATAPDHLRAQGKQEWTKLAGIYRTLKETQERERYQCD